MAKPLRDITPKSPREGQFSGKRSSKITAPKIDDTNLYTWAGGKDGIDFIKKHEIETHDYPHDAEVAFTGGKVKKAEMERHGHEPKPKDVKVYKKANEETEHVDEATKCNMTESGVFCEVHGEQSCPSGQGSDQKMKSGQKLLTDKKRLQEVLSPKNVYQINELSKETLLNYKIKANKDPQRKSGVLRAMGKMNPTDKRFPAPKVPGSGPGALERAQQQMSKTITPEFIQKASNDRNVERSRFLQREDLAVPMLETGKKKKLKKEQTDTPMTYPSGNIGDDNAGGGKV